MKTTENNKKAMFQIKKNATNNQAEIIGVVLDKPMLNPTTDGANLYIFTLSVPRLSETHDNVKVEVPDNLLNSITLNVGDEIKISGQFRSYNSYENGKRKLILTVFALNMCHLGNIVEDSNLLYLNGYVCKEPIYRITPLGREIADIMLAVNRSDDKTDYIPLIAWGKDARLSQSIHVGDNIKIWGRIQSRNYQKQISENEFVEKTAYEVSVRQLKIA